jgi:hypothetical protein
MSNEDIVAYVAQLEAQSKALKEEALRLAWYMRGSLSYDEAMFLGQTDREIISKIVKDNLETSKKSGMPFF